MEHSELAAAPLNSDQGDRILNKVQVAELGNFSIRHLERLEEEGIAPPRVHLGARRIGYWHSDVIAWLRARTGPSKQKAA